MLRISLRIALIIVLVLGILSGVSAKTRWSSLHIVPDADLYSMGEWTGGADIFLSKDSAGAMNITPTIPLRFGFSEWVNLDVAYAGGVSVGIKARLLGETKGAMPSLAIGVHNLFASTEANYYGKESNSDNTGEPYLALDKSIDPIKTRINLGIQSIPASEEDQYNGFASIEKYFGRGLYTSLEFFMRQQKFHLALFANWRFLKDHFELSVGAVELKSMFFDNNNKFAFSLAPAKADDFVRPGIWVGLRYHGRFGSGANKGFLGVEDRIGTIDASVDLLTRRLDSLRTRQLNTDRAMTQVHDTLKVLMDSVYNDPSRLDNIILSKVITLSNLFTTDPFDPDKVKLLSRDIASFREKAVPALAAIVKDEAQDRSIRTVAVGLLGDMAAKGSSSLLMDILARSSDAALKIEALISLGKMKETRAVFLMEQLANDPDDAVAMTAQEVLRSLAARTGVEISPNLRMRSVAIDENRALSQRVNSKPELVNSPEVVGHPSDTAGWDAQDLDKKPQKHETAAPEIKTGSNAERVSPPPVPAAETAPVVHAPIDSTAKAPLPAAKSDKEKKADAEAAKKAEKQAKSREAETKGW